MSPLSFYLDQLASNIYDLFNIISIFPKKVQDELKIIMSHLKDVTDGEMLNNQINQMTIIFKDYNEKYPLNENFEFEKEMKILEDGYQSVAGQLRNFRCGNKTFDCGNTQFFGWSCANFKIFPIGKFFSGVVIATNCLVVARR